MKTLAIALAGSLLLGQAATPVFVGDNSTLTWTHNGKDTAGAPEVLATGEIALYASGVDPAAPTAVPLARVAATDPTGVAPTAIKTLVQGRADGDYVVAVRVADVVGNTSAPTSLLVRKDSKAPSPVTGIKATITITITVP